jgi:hypothetical protein
MDLDRWLIEWLHDWMGAGGKVGIRYRSLMADERKKNDGIWMKDGRIEWMAWSEWIGWLFEWRKW